MRLCSRETWGHPITKLHTTIVGGKSSNYQVPPNAIHQKGNIYVVSPAKMQQVNLALEGMLETVYNRYKSRQCHEG